MEKLSCPICLSPHFDCVDTLRSTLIAVATSEITCPVCQETLKGLDKLTIHLFTHIDAFKNTKVTGAVTEPSLDTVEQGIEEEITNVQIVQATETRTLRCDICNFTFSDANILDMHQKLLHQTLEDTATGLYSYHCHLCSKKFKMKGSLMVHLRVAHYGFTNSKSDVDLANSLQKLKTNEEPTKKWSCDVCNKLFTTKYFLKKHKRLHTGEMPYFCAQCNKYFTFQQSYRKHMLYHSSEKPHVCTECGRAFKELSTLHNHERIHSGERPFACETCGKCFRQRVSYLVHKRIHTGVMPYKCAACEKTFRYKVSQRSHKCPGPTTASTKPVENDVNATASSPSPSPSPNVNIVFNADGQIIGQNFTFDGQNLITYPTDSKPTTINEESLKQLLNYGPVNTENIVTNK